MKIALVNTSRGWGGAEEQMLAMTWELKRRGHAVSVVARHRGLIHDRFESKGHRVLSVHRTGLKAVVSPFLVAAQIRKEQFDIIHSHRDHDLPLGKLLSLAGRAPLLLTQHCLPNKPSAFLYGLADRVVAVSEYIASGIRAKLPSIGTRLGVIVNGIDPLMFANPDREFCRRHPQVGERGPLLGVVGAFYKGQEELLAMLPGLREVFPQLTLILIGEDDSRKHLLVEQAKRLGVTDAVVFIGRIPREQMKDALAGVELNVSTFRNEGFGLSVIEGLAVGTPFVGYRAGGYPEIITDDSTGFLADGATELANAIISMLSADSKSRSKQAEACVATSDKFSLSRMVDMYEATYASLKGVA
jgi:glycosyltransferase involved in cell wall biosynthesis